MKKLARSALALSIGLGLTACGGDSVTQSELPPFNSEPTILTVDGAAVKGIFISASVVVYKADDLNNPISSGTQTDENGEYSLNIQNPDGTPFTGAIVVKIVADEDTVMICDAAVDCNGYARGTVVPSSELEGLELSTFTYANSGLGDSTDVDINSLTTMATDAILAGAAENDDIDLGDLDAESSAQLQVSGSEVVAAILGINLQVEDPEDSDKTISANIFDLEIVDASMSDDVPTEDAIAATLTLINASLASIEVTDSETFATSLTSYLDATAEVSAAVFQDSEIDLAAEFPDTMAEIAVVQTHIATESTAIQTAVESESESGTEIPAEEIPAVVDPADISQGIEDVITGAGQEGTGATGSNN